MTDNTNAIAESLIETGELTEQVKLAAIDAMVSGRSDTGPQFTPPSRLEGLGHAAFDGSDRDLTDEEAFAIAQDVAVHADDNADFDGEARSIERRLNELGARLNEKRYDSLTGKPSFVIAEGTQQRRALESQARSMINALKQAVFNAKAVKSERAARAAQRQANEAESALRFAWAGNDPARQRALDDALLREEAGALALKILELRKR